MAFVGPLNITKVFDNPIIWHVVGLVKIRHKTEILQTEGPHLSECIFKMERILRGIENGSQELVQTPNGSSSNKYVHSDARVQPIYRYPYGEENDQQITSILVVNNDHQINDNSQTNKDQQINDNQQIELKHKIEEPKKKQDADYYVKLAASRGVSIKLNNKKDEQDSKEESKQESEEESTEESKE